MRSKGGYLFVDAIRLFVNFPFIVFVGVFRIASLYRKVEYDEVPSSNCGTLATADIW